MDVVRPRDASASPRPAVLLVHGGGFRAGAKESYLPLAIKLAERGYLAATVNYRLAPRNQFPAAVQDVKAAVRFLRANAAKCNLDSSHIGALGGSAGGHLVLMLGLTAGVEEFEGSGPNRDQASAVQCVVDEYGPTDFTQSYSKSVDAAEVLPKFLGGDLDHERPAHIRASPLNWVTPSAAPVLAIHGTADPYVAYEQSLWIVERLIAAGVPAELETISGAGHGFKAPMPSAPTSGLRLVRQYLKPKPVSHTLLISDHGPNGEIAEIEWPSGKVLWTAPNDHGHDVQALPGGHVLFTINPQKKVVELDGAQGGLDLLGGFGTPDRGAAPANGNTLISDARLGKVIEVTPDKRVVWTYQSPDLANMRSRNAHRTGGGTTLIAVEAEGKIIEVDRGRQDRLGMAGAERERPQALHGTPACERQYRREPLGSRESSSKSIAPVRSFGPSEARTQPFKWDGRRASRFCPTATSDQRLHGPANHRSRRQGQSRQPMAHRLANHREHRSRAVNVLTGNCRASPLQRQFLGAIDSWHGVDIRQAKGLAPPNWQRLAWEGLHL